MDIILKGLLIQRKQQIIVEWEVKEQIPQHHLVAKLQFCISEKGAGINFNKTIFPFY